MLNALEIYASEGYDRTQKHLATVSGMDSMEAVLVLISHSKLNEVLWIGWN